MADGKHSLAEWAQAGARFAFRRATPWVERRPHFLVIGAQKGGTTSLYRYLVRHPGISPALRKEVHFFDMHFRRGLGWYRAHFPRASLTGEASPYYLFHPHAPGRVAELWPDVRLVALLRDPVERAWSHYRHEVRKGRESRSFEEAVRAEADELAPEWDRVVADPSYVSRPLNNRSYVARGRYAEQLRRWLEHFPADQLLVLESEALFDDPGEVVGEVLDFLDVGRADLGPYRPFNQHGDRGDVSPELEAWLRERYRPHDEALRTLLGRSFRWMAS